MIKVSVIIPVHNSAKYLDRVLFSLQNQTLPDIEFIFVENGSTDDSYKKLLEIAKKEARARVFNIGQSTIGGAVNFGIAKARGEFITLNDHDDFYVKDGLKTLYTNVTKNSALAVISNIINIQCKTINNNLYKKFNLQTRNIEATFRKSNILSVGWACLVKRDFVLNKHIEYIKTNLHHDTVFFADLWQEIYAEQNGEKLINFMPNYISYVRIVEPSTSMTYASNNRKKIPHEMYKKLHPSVYTFKAFNKIIKKNKKLYKNILESENIVLTGKFTAINILGGSFVAYTGFSRYQWIVFTYHLVKCYKAHKDYFFTNFTETKSLSPEMNAILYSLEDVAQSKFIATSWVKLLNLVKLIRKIVDIRQIDREFMTKITSNEHDDENCFCRDENFDVQKEIIDKFYNNDNSSIINQKTSTMLW